MRYACLNAKRKRKILFTYRSYLWRERINQKQNKEVKYMDSDKEWVQLLEEKLLKTEEPSVERNYLHKIPFAMSSYERINVETLKKNYEFSRVYRKGKYFSGKYLTINVLESIYAYNRIGVSVSRKAYKSSVKRNLYRRRIKEILRTGNFNLKKGYDIVFVVKKTDEIPKYQDIEKEIIDLLIRAKLIIKDEETNNQID